MTITPGYKRTIRVAATATVVSIACSGLIQALNGLEQNSFVELMNSFLQLGAPTAHASKIPASLLSSIVGFLLFSFPAVWSGLKLTGFARIMATAQLIILGWVYEWGVWQLLGQSSAPISQALATIIGCVSGVWLKVQEVRKSDRDARHYELKLRNQELQESRLALVKNDETERRLLAADLHDQVLNDLKGIMEKLNQYGSTNDPAVLLVIDDKMRQVMVEIREIMDNLCPVVLEHFGLAAAIEECLEKGSQRAGFDIRFKQSDEAEKLVKDLSDVEQQLLYRLIQESVTNICKHANASLVQASIAVEDSDLLFAVVDNGKGLDPDKAIATSRGLGYMRLRAALIGARIRWAAGKDGKGTSVEIRINSPANVS